MEILDDSESEASCSFCLKSHREVGPLIEIEAGAFVCRACIDLCQHIFEMESIRRGVSIPDSLAASEPMRSNKPEVLFRVIGVRAGGSPVVLDELPFEAALDMQFRLKMAKVLGNVAIEAIKPPDATLDGDSH